MPANLTPEYKAAEGAFRQARDPRERLQWLREMLRTVPKHKGTDHLQADIKTRIKQLTEELAGPKKGAAHGGPAISIPPEGAAQVALIGPPNSGKSALHVKLTGSNAQVGPYPFTTQYPQPGMLPFEDVSFQLVDLPPIAPERPIPWMGNALERADASLLVLDLTSPSCINQISDLLEHMGRKRVHLTSSWPRNSGGIHSAQLDDPFALLLPTLMLVNKADMVAGIADELAVFRELSGVEYPVLPVSAETGEGLDAIGPWLFRKLEIIRVYTKAPGRSPDQGRPFTVRHGGTVGDVARLVHKDFSQSLKFAKLWRRGRPGVQQVGRGHPVEDGDLLELHT
jgi:ribosome-interacting GTPase 1